MFLLANEESEVLGATGYESMGDNPSWLLHFCLLSEDCLCVMTVFFQVIFISNPSKREVLLPSQAKGLLTDSVLSNLIEHLPSM
jgi:hypothetical protein